VAHHKRMFDTVHSVAASESLCSRLPESNPEGFEDGSQAKAGLDTNFYPGGMKVSNGDLNRIKQRRGSFPGD
jgi:hypothetical protein